jgi:hypothetical protein
MMGSMTPDQLKAGLVAASSAIGVFAGVAFIVFGLRAVIEIRRGPGLYRHLFQGESFFSSAGDRYFKRALLSLAIAILGGFGLPLLLRLP